MAKLKPEDVVDLIVGPAPYTDEDAAAVSRAMAEYRKRPQYRNNAAALHRTIDGPGRANAQASVLRSKKKAS